MTACDLRWGDYRCVLSDVAQVDAVITDPPYSKRTHSKQRHGRRDERTNNRWVSSRGIQYPHWDESDVTTFVDFWAPRNRGWFAVFTDSELYPAWRDSLRGAGLLVFAPLGVIQVGMNVRLAGDGPSSWTVWLVVARPKALRKWGTLPGGYYGNPFDGGENSATATRRSSVVGGKPLWLMRAVVRDYSRPGDLVCDPCAGGATTLIAAALEDRRGVGAEFSLATYELARGRIDQGEVSVRAPKQVPLFDNGELSL